jgi:hypothetical protein
VLLFWFFWCCIDCIVPPAAGVLPLALVACISAEVPRSAIRVDSDFVVCTSAAPKDRIWATFKLYQ